MEQKNRSIGAELDAVAQMAAESLREFEAHEQEWNDQLEAIRRAAPVETGWSQGLERYFATKPDLRAVAERLEADLAPIDADLAELENAFQDWLKDAGDARERWRQWLARQTNEDE